MQDRFGRTIDYLRVAITDRCNLRCRYCEPRSGFRPLRHQDILSFEEIVVVAETAVRMGVRKVRLTGGEPLVRRDAVRLVEMLGRIPGIEDLAMTTNGTLLAEHAVALKRSGLGRVNVSLDTVDPERYREITDGGDIRAVLEGIEAAKKAGLLPVKLNCVVTRSSREPDAVGVAKFALRNGLEARFIRKMDTSTGTFEVVEGGKGGDCPRCNRLRISSDGMLRPCLFSDLAFPVREFGAKQAIELALEAKPESGTRCTRNWIRITGG